MRFQGRVVLVAGAAGGVGRATARAFAREGAALAVCDKDPAGLEELQRELEDTPLIMHDVDVTSRVQIDGFLQEVYRKFGAIDILANCVGAWHSAPVEEIAEAIWDHILAVNLKATFFLCQCCFSYMRRKGKGAIINIASTAGEYGSIRPAAHYAAAKGGVIAFSKSLAREGAPAIRVNVVSPGPIDTAMLAEHEEERREIAKRPLLQRLAKPEEIAAAILYLASDDAGFITGEVLRVNGGSLI